MKKFIIYPIIEILAIVSFLVFTACTPLTRCEYSCTVKYSIDGTSHTETVTLKMADACTPTAILNGDGLMIVGYPSTYWQERSTIYRGSLPVKLEDFEYHLVRKYKASNWDGHEITKK